MGSRYTQGMADAKLELEKVRSELQLKIKDAEAKIKDAEAKIKDAEAEVNRRLLDFYVHGDYERLREATSKVATSKGAVSQQQ